MSLIEYRDWDDFTQRFLLPYSRTSEERRRQLIFRGQANAAWDLSTTLDRQAVFQSSTDRNNALEQLISEFRRQARGLSIEKEPGTLLEWELLGRHHGLPTSVLDFTRSPYVAAYFAFWETQPKETVTGAIWSIDRQVFADEGLLPELVLIDEDEAVRYNVRAIEQEGLFVKIKDSTRPLASLLGRYLHKHTIPTDNREQILAALSSMRITARNLFRDLDGAARSACNVTLIKGGGRHA